VSVDIAGAQVASSPRVVTVARVADPAEVQQGEIEAAWERVQTRQQELDELAARLRTTQQKLAQAARAPQPEPPPAAPVATPTPDASTLILAKLEGLLREQPHADRWVQEEREAMVRALRQHVDGAGRLPRQLEMLAVELLDELRAEAH
jgi:hypothetical protein